MDCREANKLLMPFVDDELAPPVSYDVDRHLAACAACRAEAETIRALDARVRGACRRAGAAPADLPERIARAIAAAPRAPRSPLPRLRTRLGRAAAALAAAVLVAATAIIAFPAGPAAADYANDHLRCVGMRQTWISDAEQLARLCEVECGAPIAPPCLEKAGYRLEGGAVCEVDGVRCVHLLYVAEGRAPVSVYVGDPRALGRGDRARREGPLEVARIRCPSGKAAYIAVGPVAEMPVVAPLIRSRS